MPPGDLGRSRKRGRPRHDESPGNQKKKTLIDKQARLETRELLVKLMEAAPIIKQMLEAYNSRNMGEEATEGLGGAATMAPRSLCEQCNQNLGLQPLIPPFLDSYLNEELLETLASPAAPSYPTRFDGSFYEEVYKFFEDCQWNGNTKREGSISDFPGLQDEINEHEFPPSLLPIKRKITEAYGDITQKLKLSDCAARPTIIKFYATVRNMDELTQVEDVSMKKLRCWRDAIIDAQQIGLLVAFAELHLKRIAHVYVAMASNEDQMKELKVEFDRIGKMLGQHQLSFSEAMVFQDKPLNAGLFPYPYPYPYQLESGTGPYPYQFESETGIGRSDGSREDWRG